MVSGVTGHLIAAALLDDLGAHASVPLPPPSAARGFAEWRIGCRPLGPASSLRAMMETGLDPLLRLLGFCGVESIEAGHGAWFGTIAAVSPPVMVAATGWGESLERLWRAAIVEAARRGAAWCVLFNGTHVRLLDAQRVYTRRWLQIDLDLAADDDRARTTLWQLLAPATLSRTATAGPAIDTIVALSERHGAAVCRALRDGVLAASTEVFGALVKTARPDLRDGFEQALTIVYRIVFLLFAEARALVPMWHPVYRESYSVDALRRSAERRPSPPGLWEALRAISRLAHQGCRAGDLRVTAFNGRLFAPARTPLVDRQNLDNESARRAVLALATRPTVNRDGRERIAYGDLGVEQLGAVYETLLDYEPKIEPQGSGARDAARPAGPKGPTTAGPKGPALHSTVTLVRGSGLRKATGTFYTPQPIAQYLVRRTLAPLVDDAPAEQILGLRVVDPAMGSGAFLVAACEYLARAYEHALVRGGGCHPSDIGAPERAAIRRTVAERCLYGVDLNPMAVQLARLSLWLLTLAADRPLTFLDHHLRAGDSLLGAWLANLRRAPAARRRRQEDDLPLFASPAFGEALRDALPVRFELAAPDDTVERVRSKERALARLERPDTTLSKWKRIADLWCACWFSRPERLPGSAFASLTDAILTGAGSIPPSLSSSCLDEAGRIARERRFVHWELEFPEVFFESGGGRRAAPGFDAVLGNPPWDMIRADSGAEAAGVVRFTRDAGVYEAQSDGHANRYQLFLERALALTRSGGRIGLVLPSGMTADHGSARLRRHLFARSDVDAIVGFDNREGVFPIHRSVRFVLVTATAGRPTGEIACRLGERSPDRLDAAEADGAAWFPVRVTPEALERLTGPDLALPELRSPVDLAIAERAAALFAPLGDERGWGVRFGRELNASEDSGRFLPPRCGLPVVEGKQIDPFRIAIERSRWSIPERDAEALLGARHRAPRLAYRDVAGPANRLTLIAALLPPGTVSTHTVFCLRSRLPLPAQHVLCGLFNSFVVNYLVRLRVTTHVTTGIVERLPLPRIEEAPRTLGEIGAIARALMKVRLKPRDGPPIAAAAIPVVSGFSRTLALARLNALVAELYQLTASEFAHVLDTFPLVPRDDREAARQEFQNRRVCAR